MVNADQVEVEDEAVALNAAGAATRCRCHVKNTTGHPAYLGGADVAEETGYELGEDEAIVVELAAGDVLYAVSTERGTVLAVLRS